jgi:hypothetical protein
MFLMTYLKFASNILSLDMGSFEKIHIVSVLGGKRLLWKPMGNYLVYSSLQFVRGRAIAIAVLTPYERLFTPLKFPWFPDYPTLGLF